MTLDALRKYPRTRHLEGSRLQPGDQDLAAVPFEEIRGRYLVVEEKLDGANAAVSFDPAGEMLLQSRGHYLTGGRRERHFEMFKRWAATHFGALRDLLGARYVMYGEWLYAKHTIFYDALPHYFLEFDVLDRESGAFLSTARRRRLLAGSPVRSVPVLAERTFDDHGRLLRLAGRSLYKTASWRERLAAQAARHLVTPERAAQETDPSDGAEGLYLKVEEHGAVVGRYKHIRSSFLTSVLDSGSHWLSRPIVPNLLAEGVDIFATERA